MDFRPLFSKRKHGTEFDLGNLEMFQIQDFLCLEISPKPLRSYYFVEQNPTYDALYRHLCVLAGTAVVQRPHLLIENIYFSGQLAVSSHKIKIIYGRNDPREVLLFYFF